MMSRSLRVTASVVAILSLAHLWTSGVMQEHITFNERIEYLLGIHLEQTGEMKQLLSAMHSKGYEVRLEYKGDLESPHKWFFSILWPQASRVEWGLVATKREAFIEILKLFVEENGVSIE